MKTLVSQELRPLSWPKFTKLLYQYLKNPAVGIKLTNYVDMDYLHELEYDDREFIVDFLFEWYRSYLDSHVKRRDVYHQYDRGQTTLDSIGFDTENYISNVDRVVERKVIKMWDKKLINSYTIRDYMPSKTFDEDGIIEYIDHINLKRKKVKK